MFRKKDVDITAGRLLPSILAFAAPVIIGSMVQNLFNAVDIIVLGQFADAQAVASVGVTSPIVNLIVLSFVGLSAGAGVLIARFIGAQDGVRVKKTVSTALITAFALGLLIGVVGVAFSKQMLLAVGCPENCLADATLYMQIYLAGAPAIMLYNFGASIIRVSGDSERPLYYLIAAGLLNGGMNVVLCLILTQKVIAVAVATTASQILGAILVIIHLFRSKSDCSLDIKALTFDRDIFLKILMYGLPSALNTSLYAISNLQIASAINSFGEAFISGNTAAASLESFISSITGGFGVAALTFVGQNIGAGNQLRVRNTIFVGAATSFAITAAASLLLRLLSHQALSLYIPGEEVAIGYGTIRVSLVLSFYFIPAINAILGNSLQAFGYSILSMLNNIVAVLGFRIIWMFFVYPQSPTPEMLYLCYPISWSISVLMQIIVLLIVYARYRKGKLVKI
ncbi:MAG: MATE family efflux transporter [Clostridia bacterium]|nr:MATE family efflux transporter [Clostridia bacterium]